MNLSETKKQDAIDTFRTVAGAVKDRQQHYLGLLEAMVNIDSGIDSPAGIRKVQELACNALGESARPQWCETSGVSHLKLSMPGANRRICLLGHADTVFPKGTAASRPFSVTGGLAHGPGVADMKGGVVVALAAVALLLEMGASIPGLEIVVVGDEETRTIRPPFMDALTGLSACLVLECGRPEGGFVVSRKGGVWATLKARGRSAHSGVSPESGDNAITALCRETLRIAQLHTARPGLSVVPGKFNGGQAVNVVPEFAEVLLDIRSDKNEDITWALRECRQHAPGSTIEFDLHCDLKWPPMPEDNGRKLSLRYQELAKITGVNVRPVFTGGMSDGNWFCQAMIPTLDGLGPIGGMDHGPKEYIEVDSIAIRAGLLAAFITTFV